MKKKIIIGGLSALLIFGGAAAVGASKSGTPEDSIHLEDKNTSITIEAQNLPEISAGQEIELETEHGKTFYKVESDDSNSISTSKSAGSLSIEEAAKIALANVNGTITEVENEMEHGRLEYKFEILSNRGEVDVRVDAQTGEVTRVEFDDNGSDD